MTEPTAINIIIPTLATKERGDGLLRTLQLLRVQFQVQAKPIVVINGDQYDRELSTLLSEDPKIKVIHSMPASVSKARYVGRLHVDSEYFAFLDDDDEFTPNALVTRLEPLLQDPKLDAVVTNGFRQTLNNNEKTTIFKNFPTHNSDPASALINENWLASCGGLFRTATIDELYFKHLKDYFEWTSFAFNLALNANLCFINEPTFIVNKSPSSLSQSIEYSLEEPELLKSLINSQYFSKKDEATLKKRLASAYNRLANYYLGKGELKESLYYHAKCTLSSRYGWPYIPWMRYCVWHLFNNRMFKR